MNPTLLSILVAALVLFVLFHVVRMFIKGMVLTIIGLILGLIFLIHTLRAFGIVRF